MSAVSRGTKGITRDQSRGTRCGVEACDRADEEGCAEAEEEAVDELATATRPREHLRVG